jgi:methionine-S-sulfoxide reductase
VCWALQCAGGQGGVQATLAALGASHTRAELAIPPPLPLPATRPAQQQQQAGLEVATFALGCFWGAELSFSCVRGVTDTQVGYISGTQPPAGQVTYRTYRSLGFTEAVEVVFAPSQRTYESLLDIFWRSHSATQPTVGRAYRSAIFCHTDAQCRAALQARAQLNARLATGTAVCRAACRDATGTPVSPCDGSVTNTQTGQPIRGPDCAVFTAVESAATLRWNPAEVYHQQWERKAQSTCISAGYDTAPWQAPPAPSAPTAVGGSAGAGH